MKKFLLSSVILLIVFSSAWAVPALRRTMDYEQPDGTKITLTLHGDENFHYFVNEQGKVFLKDTAGFFKNVTTKQFNQLKTKKMAVKKAPSRAQSLTRNLAPRVLVLLVQYTDVKFNSENTQAAFNDMLNSDNYSYSKTIRQDGKNITVKADGSAKAYFQHQSAGKYVPQCDVVGPVTLSKSRSYYGGNDSKGDDLHPAEMVVEACQLAESKFNVDFGLYDNNSDGYVDFVFVIYAGENEAEGGSENAIWPHAWSVRNIGTYKVGKNKQLILDDYACTSELNSLSIRAGIGTFCHEFSHVLGLPDFYSTDNSTTHETLGSWDIMDYGPYNNHGNTPPNYSAYERWFMGWLTPTVLKGEKKVSLNDIDSRAAGLIFEEEEHNMDALNPSPTTFYLVENRQQKNWDKDLNGHGLMITKVKFDALKWYSNKVNNNPADMGVDLIEAGESGGNDSRDLPTELFPAGATSYFPFTDYSITNIIEEDGVITFDFKGGKEHLKLDIDDILANDPDATIFDIMGNRIERKDVKTGVVYILRQNGQVQKFQIK